MEWDFQQEHMGVMGRCPQTFGYVVYLSEPKNLTPYYWGYAILQKTNQHLMTN